MMHAGVPNAPFGGVGESGYGAYHGKHGLNTFSHTRTVVAPPTWLDKVMGFRYPPYKMSNKSKLAVKNRLGFKRGEGIEDQVIGRRAMSSSTKVLLVLVVAGSVLALYVISAGLVLALYAVIARAGGIAWMEQVLRR